MCLNACKNIYRPTQTHTALFWTFITIISAVFHCFLQDAVLPCTAQPAAAELRAEPACSFHKSCPAVWPTPPLSSVLPLHSCRHSYIAPTALPATPRPGPSPPPHSVFPAPAPNSLSGAKTVGISQQAHC